MEEIFIPFEQNYAISNFGNIKNLITNRILKTRPSHKGYMKTNISIKGKIKTIFVHQLVAKYFLNNFNDLPQVNHKDGNKQNNRADNLEWCTPSENVRHAYKNGLNNGNGKIVHLIDQNGKTLRTFKSCKQAEKFLKHKPTCNCVWRTCNNKNNCKNWTY